MLESLKSFQDKMKAVHAEMRKQGEIGLKEGLKEFFAAYPEIHSVQWTQYTPGFNDGDPCEFGVGGVGATLTNEAYTAFTGDEVDSEVVEDEDYDYDTEGIDGLSTGWGNSKKYVNERAKEIEESFEQLARIIESDAMEDILETLFGIGTKVIATAEKIVTEDYDCGY